MLLASFTASLLAELVYDDRTTDKSLTSRARSFLLRGKGRQCQDPPRMVWGPRGRFDRFQGIFFQRKNKKKGISRLHKDGRREAPPGAFFSAQIGFPFFQPLVALQLGFFNLVVGVACRRAHVQRVVQRVVKRVIRVSSSVVPTLQNPGAGGPATLHTPRAPLTRARALSLSLSHTHTRRIITAPYPA